MFSIPPQLTKLTTPYHFFSLSIFEMDNNLALNNSQDFMSNITMLILVIIPVISQVDGILPPPFSSAVVTEKTKS